MTQQLHTYASLPYLSPFLPSVSLSIYPSFPSSPISHSLYLPLCLTTPFNLSQNGSYLIEPNESGLCLVHKPFYLGGTVSILLCASLATHYLKYPPSLLHLLTPQLPISPHPCAMCPYQVVHSIIYDVRAPDTLLHQNTKYKPEFLANGSLLDSLFTHSFSYKIKNSHALKSFR